MQQSVKQNILENSVMVEKTMRQKTCKKNSKKKISRQGITKVAVSYFNKELRQELETLWKLKLFSLLHSYENYNDGGGGGSGGLNPIVKQNGFLWKILDFNRIYYWVTVLIVLPMALASNKAVIWSPC